MGLIRHQLFPLHEWAKKHSTLSMFEELERTQWLDREALRGLQEEKLGVMLRSVRAHIPYYRDLPEEVGLLALPFLTKTTIREHREQMGQTWPKGWWARIPEARKENLSSSILVKSVSAAKAVVN